MNMLMIGFNEAIFIWQCLRCLGLPSLDLVDFHLEGDRMPLHDVVGVNYQKSALLKIKAQVPGIWAKGCVLCDCVGVI